jgi:hypothetical protein
MLPVSDKSGAQRMSAVVEMQSTVRRMAKRYGKLDHAFSAIARKLGVTPRRVKSFHDGKADPKARELDRARAVSAALSEAVLTTEILIHAAELDSHAARLAAVDPDFHGPEIARLRDAARRARNAIA